jgi:hypothetical protein
LFDFIVKSGACCPTCRAIRVSLYEFSRLPCDS